MFGMAERMIGQDLELLGDKQRTQKYEEEIEGPVNRGLD